MAIKSEEWGNRLLRTAIFSVLSSFTVPQSVPAPSRVRGINGYSIDVTWEEPAVVRGVIEKYILRAYSQDGNPRVPRTPEASSEFVNTNTLTGMPVPYGSKSRSLSFCFDFK